TDYITYRIISLAAHMPYEKGHPGWPVVSFGRRISRLPRTSTEARRSWKVMPRRLACRTPGRAIRARTFRSVIGPTERLSMRTGAARLLPLAVETGTE